MEKALTVFLGTEPGTAEWSAQTNPLSFLSVGFTVWPNVTVVHNATIVNHAVGVHHAVDVQVKFKKGPTPLLIKNRWKKVGSWNQLILSLVSFRERAMT